VDTRSGAVAAVFKLRDRRSGAASLEVRAPECAHSPAMSLRANLGLDAEFFGSAHSEEYGIFYSGSSHACEKTRGSLAGAPYSVELCNYRRLSLCWPMPWAIDSGTHCQTPFPMKWEPCLAVTVGG